ncbi:hypothetical protein [Candidatus Amarolinea aalborgensis]|uniref:hypothetical protein n=1 Tax=Candidatus Amarolinea aalborgensis TaxID=2249329 RepID=UPI003BF99AFB
MSGVHADIEKMESFLDHLRRFDQLLDDEFRSMIGHWRDLGSVWTDNKYHEFGRDLEEVARGVEHYLAATDDHENHLARLIERLKIFLDT